MSKLPIFAVAALFAVAACEPKAQETPSTDDAVVEAPPADATAPGAEPVPATIDSAAAPLTDPAAAPATDTAAQPQH